MGEYALKDRSVGLGFVLLLMTVLAVSLNALAESGILESQTATILSATLSIMIFIAVSWTIRPLVRWIPWRTQWLAISLYSIAVFISMITSYPSTVGGNSILGLHIAAALISFFVVMPDLEPLDERLNATLGALHE